MTSQPQMYGRCVAAANSPMALVEKGLKQWLRIGIPPSKLVLGLPWCAKQGSSQVLCITTGFPHEVLSLSTVFPYKVLSLSTKPEVSLKYPDAKPVI
jgi:hypothetical protein